MLNTYPETPSIFTSNHFDRASDIPEDADHLYSLVKDGKHKKFVCTIPDCQKVFRFHSEMQRHIASHSAFRPHRCTFEGCGREFKRPSALENHIRSQHTGEAPLLCPYPGCGLRFSTEAKYRYHIISHMDEKPHKCGFPGCNKSFMTLSQLKQHEKSPSVHKKLDVMSQLEERGRGLATPMFDEEDSFVKLERSSSAMKVEPTKKIKYDVQNKKLTELLTSLQTNPIEDNEPKAEDQTEPVLDHILTENEILRRKLESSEQMLEMMRQQISQIHNTSGAEPLPLPNLPGFGQQVAPQGQEDELDSFFIKEADSYLIHDPYVVESRPYFQEGDYFTRSEPVEGGLGDDKLSFFFPSFSFEDITFSPSRQIEK